MEKATRYLLGMALMVLLGSACFTSVHAQATQTKEPPFVVEYYYKTKWGYADEFIRLFKKNHYPVLKKQMENGRILG